MSTLATAYSKTNTITRNQQNSISPHSKQQRHYKDLYARHKQMPRWKYSRTVIFLLWGIYSQEGIVLGTRS